MFPLKDNLRCLSFAWVTVCLIGLNSCAYLWEVVQKSSGHSSNIVPFLMVPAFITTAFTSGDPGLIKDALVSVFGSMFMHGSLMHLVGNMLFLFVFGKAVENRFGKLGFLGFYLVAGLCAAATQIGSNPYSMVPMLGASGAIAGVLGAYVLFWPRADITVLVQIYPFRIRAYWFLLAWFAMQWFPILAGGQAGAGPLVNWADLFAGPGGVAYWAHIGGFIGGVIMAGTLRLIRPESDVCYIPIDCTPCQSDGSQK